jgi:type IV pilus assembly protein PilE
MTTHKTREVFSSKYLGFTLIELMIVITIIGILASLSFSFASNIFIQNHRAEAKIALINLAAELEHSKMIHGTYKNIQQKDIESSLKPADQYYDFSISSTEHSYRLSATPKVGSMQERDPCGTLTINDLNRKTAKEDKGCW